MQQDRNLIISNVQIKQKIKRIAYEITEENYGADEIIIAGICGEDETNHLAVRLKTELLAISKFRVISTDIRIDKDEPSSNNILIGLSEEQINGKIVILVDDVANSGRILFYSMKPLLEMRPDKVQVAVLVDRKHKAFPVSADYVGTRLATTMQEHISVRLSEGQEAVYLS